MINRLRRLWYRPFLRLSLATWTILLLVEAGFASRSTQRKLGKYTADVLAWGCLILVIIYSGEILGLPITYYDVFSMVFIRNLIIMALVSNLLHISMWESIERIMPFSTNDLHFLRPGSIMIALIMGHDFIFTPQILG